MLTIHPRVAANFFLDGAKIIFASLVVGAFIPTAAVQFPIQTFVGGAIMTTLFLIAAHIAAHKEDDLKFLLP